MPSNTCLSAIICYYLRRIVGPGGFKSTTEVILQFPLHPITEDPKPTVYLSIQSEGQWKEVESPEKVRIRNLFGNVNFAGILNFSHQWLPSVMQSWHTSVDGCFTCSSRVLRLKSCSFLQIIIDEQTYMTFRSTGCEAFTAMSYSPSDSMIVGVKGGNYVSEQNGKVEIVVPQDCFDDNTTIGIKVTARRTV